MEFLVTTVAEKLDEDGIAEYDGDGNEGQIGQVLMEAVQHGGLVGRTRLKWSVERSWGSYVERPGRSREANGAGICRTGGGVGRSVPVGWRIRPFGRMAAWYNVSNPALHLGI